MGDLIAFFTARLDEKEPAKICGCLDANHWPPCTKSVADSKDRAWREIAAGRQLLAWYADSVDASAAFKEMLGTGTHMAVAAESYLNAILALAAIDSDHPDYDPAWALGLNPARSCAT